MGKSKGFMIVRYSRYYNLSETIPGRIVCVCTDNKSAIAKLKEMVEDIKNHPNLKLVSKDYRSGFAMYEHLSGGKSMISKMPYNKHISDTLL